jgi:hypothetical protein
MPRSHGCATSAGRLSLCSAILVSLAGLTALRADDGKRATAPTSRKAAAPASPTFELQVLDPHGKPVRDAAVDKKLSQRPVDLGVLTLKGEKEATNVEP